jgi:hypothetical protein
MAAPPIVLDLKPIPPFDDWMKTQDEARYEILVNHRPSFERFSPETALAVGWHSPRSAAMGSIFSDIWDFIKSIVESILSYIRAIIQWIVTLFTNPLKALKQLFHFFVDVFTGKVFLDFLANFPLTRWLYLGLDHLTGGFLENLRTLTSLPGRFLTGQHIPRSDLIKALGVVVIALAFVAAFFTGGATLAIIGASATLLKAGPLGKTALGRTLLDICAIGAGALAGGNNLIDAFVDAGEKWLEKQAIGQVAKRTGISTIIVKGAVAAGQYLTSGSGDEEEEEEGDSGDEESEAPEAEAEAPSPAPETEEPETEAPEAEEGPEAPDETGEEAEAPETEEPEAGDETEEPESEEAEETEEESEDESDVENEPPVDVSAIRDAAKLAQVTQALLIQAEKKDEASQKAAAAAARAAAIAARKAYAQEAVAHAKNAIAYAKAAIQSEKNVKAAKTVSVLKAQNSATLDQASKAVEEAKLAEASSAKANTTSATKAATAAKTAAQKAVAAATAAAATTKKKLASVKKKPKLTKTKPSSMSGRGAVKSRNRLAAVTLGLGALAVMDLNRRSRK